MYCSAARLREEDAVCGYYGAKIVNNDVVATPAGCDVPVESASPLALATASGQEQSSSRKGPELLVIISQSCGFERAPVV